MELKERTVSRLYISISIKFLLKKSLSPTLDCLRTRPKPPCYVDMAERMSEVLSIVHIWTYVATLGGCQRLFMRGFRFRSVRSLYKCKIFIMQNSTMWTVLTTVDFTNTDKNVTHQLARLHLFLWGPQKGWIVILVCVACEQALRLGKGRKNREDRRSGEGSSQLPPRQKACSSHRSQRSPPLPFP